MRTVLLEGMFSFYPFRHYLPIHSFTVSLPILLIITIHSFQHNNNNNNIRLPVIIIKISVGNHFQYVLVKYS